MTDESTSTSSTGPDQNWIQRTAERVVAKYRPKPSQQLSATALSALHEVARLQDERDRAASDRAALNPCCGIPCWLSGPACELPRNQPHTVHVAPRAIGAPPSNAPATKSNVVFNGSIPSSTDATKSYQVVLYTDGTGHCTCRGYGYRHTCSHLTLVKEAAAQS